jgi:hypothetical protein
MTATNRTIIIIKKYQSLLYMQPYVKNIGYTKTIVNNNGKKNVNKLNWKVGYNGSKVVGEMNVGHNGWTKHYDINLNNKDISRLLNVPVENKLIEDRLLENYPMHNYQHFEIPFENNAPMSPLSSLSPFSESRPIILHREEDLPIFERHIIHGSMRRRRRRRATSNHKRNKYSSSIKSSSGRKTMRKRVSQRTPTPYPRLTSINK